MAPLLRGFVIAAARSSAPAGWTRRRCRSAAPPSRPARRSRRGASWRGWSRSGPIAPLGVALVDHLHLAAAVALDAQEPRREGAERLCHRLGRRGERIVAVASPVAARCRPRGHHQLSMWMKPSISAANSTAKPATCNVVAFMGMDVHSSLCRISSRQSASAGSPRRLCSAGVISGTSPNLAPRQLQLSRSWSLRMCWWG